MDSKQNHRIVTREAYIRNMSQKAAVASTGMGLLVIGMLAVVMAIVLLIITVCAVVKNEFPWELLLSMLFCIGILGGGGILTLHICRRAMRKAKKIHPGIPLTRANIGDLPIRESLVRAADQPVQEQQAALLRATTNTNTTPAEQLARAYQEPVQEEQTSFIPTAYPALTAAATAETEPARQRAG